MQATETVCNAAVNGPVTYYVRDAGTTGTTSTRATINEETGVLTATALGAIEVVATDPRLDAPIVLPAKIVNSWVNAEIYYDDFYVEIHDDENTSADEAIQRISTEMKYLADYFMGNFGIQVNYNIGNAICQNTFVSEECQIWQIEDADDIADAICTCVTNDECHSTKPDDNGTISIIYPYHHTNVWNVLNRLGAPESQTTVRIAFTGKKYCYSDDSGSESIHSTSDGLYGVAHLEGRRAMVLSKPGLSLAVEQCALVHEFGHLFGTLDYYTGSDFTVESIGALFEQDNFTTECTYGWISPADHNTDDTMCDGCKQIIMSNYDLYSRYGM